MSHGWYKSEDARYAVGPVDVHPGQSYYLRDADAATAPEGWLRPLTDRDLAKLPSHWYAVEKPWRDGQRSVVPGARLWIDPTLAAHTMRDSGEGVLRRLTPTEVAETEADFARLKASGIAAPRPEPGWIDPQRATVGRGDPQRSTPEGDED